MAPLGSENQVNNRTILLVAIFHSFLKEKNTQIENSNVQCSVFINVHVTVSCYLPISVQTLAPDEGSLTLFLESYRYKWQWGYESKTFLVLHVWDDRAATSVEDMVALDHAGVIMYIEFLGKTLYSHSASLCPGV